MGGYRYTVGTFVRMRTLVLCGNTVRQVLRDGCSSCRKQVAVVVVRLETVLIYVILCSKKTHK